jgi:hypothetical protein
MSGNSGIRGYLLQTVVSLLKALEDNQTWDFVALEPNNESEKVDIAWYFPGNNIKASQVKSSQNQINLPDVKGWAKELEDSLNATWYELILIGPCSKEVASLGKFENVIIPAPKPLDIDGLIEQAAHRLDRYIEIRRLPKISAFTRELVVNAFIAKLENYSTSGLKVSRKDFYNLLDEWIKATIQIKEDVDNKSENLAGMKLEDWINALVKMRFSNGLNLSQKDSLAKELVEWVNQVQPAMKITKAGTARIGQGGSLSKEERWQYYSEAKKLEEILDNVIIPPVALDSHFALRESVRHYRRAFGYLYEADQDGFSEEMALATAKTKELVQLFEKVKSSLL